MYLITHQKIWYENWAQLGVGNQVLNFEENIEIEMECLGLFLWWLLYCMNEAYITQVYSETVMRNSGKK